MRAILPGGNAAALNHIAGEYYTPLQYGPSHSGGLTYNLTVDGSGRVARPSFIGRTVIEVPDSTKLISPDNIATIKPIKNPTLRVTHPDGITVSKTIPGEFNALPNGVADTFDGIKVKNNVAKQRLAAPAKYMAQVGTQTVLFTFIAALNGLMLVANQGAILFNRFRTKNSWSDDIESAYCANAENNIYVRIKKSRLTGWQDSLTDAQKTSLFEAWLTDNPIDVYYDVLSPANTYYNADLPLVPGINQFSASDKNGVLQSVTVDVIPGPEMAVPYAKNANTVAGTSKIYTLDGAGKIPIPENADLDTDTFLAPGLYACDNSSIAATVKHNPFNTAAFTLRTEIALLPTKKPHLIQTAQHYDTGALKYRSITTWTSEPIYGPWQTVATTEFCSVTPINGWAAGIADPTPFVSHKIGPLVYVMGTIKNPSATTTTSNCLSLQFPTTVFTRPFVHDVNGKAYRCEINQGIMSIRDPVSANTVLYITITYPTH